MNKKAIALMLIGILSIGLVGCGKRKTTSLGEIKEFAKQAQIEVYDTSLDNNGKCEMVDKLAFNDYKEIEITDEIYYGIIEELAYLSSSESIKSGDNEYYVIYLADMAKKYLEDNDNNKDYWQKTKTLNEIRYEAVYATGE